MDTLDQIFNLLSKERRRYALYFLDQQDGPVSVEEVIKQVAEWETNGASVSIPEEKFEQVELDLLHTDLPKASEVNYIRFDSEKGIIELTGAPPAFEAIISIAEIVERPDRNP